MIDFFNSSLAGVAVVSFTLWICLNDLYWVINALIISGNTDSLPLVISNLINATVISFERPWVIAPIIFFFESGLITGLRNTFTKSRLLLQTESSHTISAYTSSS